MATWWSGKGDKAKSEALTKEAAKGGNPTCQFNMSLICNERGEVAESNRWLRRSARQGCPEAQYALAQRYIAVDTKFQGLEMKRLKRRIKAGNLRCVCVVERGTEEGGGGGRRMPIVW